VPETFRVAWDPAASADLIEIVSFIAAETPLTARRVAARLAAAAASLRRHPRRGRRVPELSALVDPTTLAALGLEIREVVVRPWRLTYVIEGHAVRIAAVVDSRRDVVAWLERHLARFGREP
jgi:plasmid stabilization system protein ParE